jgi:predicted permease
MFVYQLLLLLYPASFRAQYGTELCAIFARRLRDASNPLAVLWIWLDAVIDVLVTALQTHWDILRQDIRYALRTFRRSPGFAATAIAVAAIGVGATTAAFTITDHVLIRPLPFPEANRIVDVWEDMSPGNYKRMEPSPANYRDWKRMNRSFSAMAASTEVRYNMVGVGDPEQVKGAWVTADLFPMLGARALLGRLITPADDRPGAPGVVVLSFGFWQSRFAGDPGVLGRRLLLNGEPFIVAGVMARGFDYPRRSTSLWTAMRLNNASYEDRNDNWLSVVAKLRPGVSLQQAGSDMQRVSESLKHEYPKDNQHVGARVVPLRNEISERSRMMLIALLGASFCVLLIACTNLANLLLARTLVRRKEVVVRSALGAGRERLVRQMLTESLILACCGGLLGVLLAAAALPLFAKLVPTALPIAAVPTMDTRVLAFALGLTLITGVCFGVLPAMRGAGDSTAVNLRTRQKERIRPGLVMIEVAISFVLLICAGLFIRALERLEQTNPGFRADNVLTLRTTLPSPKYDATARRVQFYGSVLSQAQQLPGVSSAGYISFLPLVLGGGIWPVTVAGQPKNEDRSAHQASLRFITPGYLETMEIPMLRGRSVSESDTGKTQFVAVISESFAREYWPNQDPLGRQFDFGMATRTVVGMVGDVRVRGFEQPSEPQVYVPYQQVPDGSLVGYAPGDLVVRSSLQPGALLPALRRIIADADPQQPISDVQTLNHLVEEQTAPRLLQVRVLAAFAFVAMLLAGIGIHGLLSFTVASRTQEIGVRIAIGAQTRDILAMVLRESAMLVTVGSVAGVLLAYVAGRLLESILAGVQPGDLATYAIALVVIVSVTLAGSFLPALRAVRVDPMTAMRAE